MFNANCKKGREESACEKGYNCKYKDTCALYQYLKSLSVN